MLIRISLDDVCSLGMHIRMKSDSTGKNLYINTTTMSVCAYCNVNIQILQTKKIDQI